MSRATTRREPVLRSVDPALRTPEIARHAEPSLKAVTLTTTQAVEGRSVEAYLGIVTGESTLSAAALREETPKKGLRSFLRRKPAAQASSLADAREEALRDLKARSSSKGADAVLGVTFAIQALDDLLMISATGTAVRFGTQAQNP